MRTLTGCLCCRHVEFRKLEFKNEYTQAHAILSTLARELDVLKQHDLRDIALQFPAFCPLWHSVIGYPVIKTASLKIYEILSDVNRTFLQSKMVAESSQLYFLTNDDEPADKDAYFDILAIARQCCKQGKYINLHLSTNFCQDWGSITSHFSQVSNYIAFTMWMMRIAHSTMKNFGQAYVHHPMTKFVPILLIIRR